jgi:hypothetical protein
LRLFDLVRTVKQPEIDEAGGEPGQIVERGLNVLEIDQGVKFFHEVSRGQIS